jgi:hypothetical protein
MPVKAKQDATPVPGGHRHRPDTEMWFHVGELAGLTVLFAFGAVIAAPHVGIQYWFLAAAWLTLGTAITSSALVHTSSMQIAVYLGTWSVLVPVWTIIAGANGITERWVWSSFIVISAFMVPRGVHVFAREARHHQDQASERKAIEASAEKTGYQRLFGKVDCAGVTVTDIVTTRAGEDVYLELPNNITFPLLCESQPRIESARKWRRGSVRFSEGEFAHQAVMHVTLREVLKETIDYPLDWLESPPDRTINDPLELGLYESGLPVEILFREISGLVLGVRGSGKSNFMNVFIAELSRCVDVVIWMIDLKGGQAASAWLQPWVAGETKRPVLDWVAVDKSEADIMLSTLQTWIDTRSRKNVGREKVTPSQRTPAIVLVVDELSRLAGLNAVSSKAGEPTSASLAARVEDITAAGRSAAIDSLAGTQRGTVTKVGGGDYKANCELRIGTGAVTTADASYIFNDHRSAKILTRISRIKGACLMELGESDPAPFKTYRLDPERGDIRKIAAQVGDFVPEPEPELIAAGGKGYAERWTRPSQVEYRRQIATNSLPADEEEQFFGIVDGIEGIPEAKISPSRQRMRYYIAERKLLGASVDEIYKQLEKEGLKVSKSIIHRWLNWDEDMFVAVHPNTPSARYLTREYGERFFGSTGTDG